MEPSPALTKSFLVKIQSDANTRWLLADDAAESELQTMLQGLLVGFAKVWTQGPIPKITIQRENEK
jgi:hypothetical protein